eukprot:363887-Chlamydomonas_euryale.AAC.2
MLQQRRMTGDGSPQPGHHQPTAPESAARTCSAIAAAVSWAPRIRTPPRRQRPHPARYPARRQRRHAGPFLPADSAPPRRTAARRARRRPRAGASPRTRARSGAANVAAAAGAPWPARTAATRARPGVRRATGQTCCSGAHATAQAAARIADGRMTPGSEPPPRRRRHRCRARRRMAATGRLFRRRRLWEGGTRTAANAATHPTDGNATCTAHAARWQAHAP